MCWDCNNNDKGDPYKNFRRGGVEVDDFDDVPRYRKPNGGSWSRKNRPCKKSKVKEKCDFSAYTIKGTKAVREYGWDENGHYTVLGWKYMPRTLRCCSRCGKYDWSSYTY